MPNSHIAAAIKHHAAFEKQAQEEGHTAEEFEEMHHDSPDPVMKHRARMHKAMRHLHKHDGGKAGE